MPLNCAETIFTAACGFAQTMGQLAVFRVFLPVYAPPAGTVGLRRIARRYAAAASFSRPGPSSP